MVSIKKRLFVFSLALALPAIILFALEDNQKDIIQLAAKSDAEAASAEPKQESIGYIVAIQGKASAVSTAGKTRTLQIESQIFQSDRIITKEGAKIQIMFTDNSVISQGENSEMIVDEYVFDPGKKSDSHCSSRFFKGIFRVVTGKITDINPNRFIVKTRMATIGIRGCEVGVRSRDEKEEYLILGLPKGKTIMIRKNKQFGIKKALNGFIKRRPKNNMRVIKPGVKVTASDEEGLKKDKISPEEADSFRSKCTPDKALKDEKERQYETGDNQDEATGAETTGAGDTAEGSSYYSDGGHTIDDFDTKLDVNEESTATQQSEEADSKPPTSMDSDSSSNWDWEIWSDGNVKLNGNSLMSGGSLDFKTDVIDGSTSYSLSGSGNASALLRKGSYNTVVTGSADLNNVNVGNGITPSWSGTFSMRGGSDSLDFSASGGISDNGSLNGSANSFSMQVNGSYYFESDITDSTIKGHLTGTRSPFAINGAEGEFHFKVDSVSEGSATADGAFGVNL